MLNAKKSCLWNVYLWWWILTCTEWYLLPFLPLLGHLVLGIGWGKESLILLSLKTGVARWDESNCVGWKVLPEGTCYQTRSCWIRLLRAISRTVLRISKDPTASVCSCSRVWPPLNEEIFFFLYRVAISHAPWGRVWSHPVRYVQTTIRSLFSPLFPGQNKQCSQPPMACAPTL